MKSKEVKGNQRRSKGHQRISKEIKAIQRKSQDIKGNQRKPKQTKGNQRIPKEIKGNSWESKEIKGNHRLEALKRMPPTQSIGFTLNNYSCGVHLCRPSRSNHAFMAPNLGSKDANIKNIVQNSCIIIVFYSCGLKWPFKFAGRVALSVKKIVAGPRELFF